MENYRLTRDKLGTGINGSVIKGTVAVPTVPKLIIMFSVQNRETGQQGALKIIFKNSRNSETEVKLHVFATQCPNVRQLYCVRFRLMFRW